MKAWRGRFRRETAKAVEEFTASVHFDRRLYRQDIAGSIAHARMLGNRGIISRDEADVLVRGLEEVRAELEEGTFPFRSELEDIHLNIERRLAEKVGPVAGKLHTARSRNDQVALDMHLFVRDEIDGVQELLTGLQEVILNRAEEHLDTIIPGYTHLQRAQPVLFSHHLLAYFHMFQRDYERFRDCRRRADVMPLGAAALAGTSFPVDQEEVAGALGFSRIYENSLDAVSDRDFVLEFLAAASVTMMHLSRLAEEMVLWSTEEFGFVEMDDAYATGSSIMPQKKNPDVAELIRGKTGRVYGHLVGLLVVMKGLPLAYNRDLQEDKEALFDGLDTLKASLAVMAGMLKTAVFHRDRMGEAAGRDFSGATDLADYLARQGVPFREAHELVGNIVLHCLETGRRLQDLTAEELRSFSGRFGADALDLVRPEAVVASRAFGGGTAPAQVRKQLVRARRVLQRRRGL